jgi:hypothetical protein
VNVSICIPVLARQPNYKPEFLECLAAIHRNTPIGFEVILVDGGRWPCGYVQPANQAMRAAKHPVRIVLNQDAVPQPGWIEPLLAAIDDGCWLVSSSQPADSLAGWCVAFHPEAYNVYGGFPDEYTVWYSITDLERRTEAHERPMRNCRASLVTHGNYARPSTVEYVASLDHPRLAAWCAKDQAIYEERWGPLRDDQVKPYGPDWP